VWQPNPSLWQCFWKGRFKARTKAVRPAAPLGDYIGKTEQRDLAGDQIDIDFRVSGTGSKLVLEGARFQALLNCVADDGSSFALVNTYEMPDARIQGKDFDVSGSHARLRGHFEGKTATGTLSVTGDDPYGNGDTCSTPGQVGFQAHWWQRVTAFN
jgi:hypothetical protein